jgi:hypothetical protein
MTVVSLLRVAQAAQRKNEKKERKKESDDAVKMCLCCKLPRSPLLKLAIGSKLAK